MKFLLALLPLASYALAATTTSTSVVTSSTGSTVTQTATATATLTPQQQCIKACNANDVNCQAQCVGVPHPGNAQMNATTNCVANCPQGDGSAQANNAYAVCRNNCISSYIVLSGTAAPGGPYTTAGQSASTTGVSTTTAGPAQSGSQTTSNAKTTSASGFAAPTGVRLGTAGGSLGLVLAAFALL